MHTTNWKLKQLLLCHLIVALLIGSLLWPVTAGLWRSIDVLFFKAVNSTLENRPEWQVFWALANHKLADWVEDVVILLFWFTLIRAIPRNERTRGVAQFVFCTLFVAAILYFVNRMLFRETLVIPRESPTLLIDSSIKLSEHIRWMKIKDDSSYSFPGDHGTTAILFAATFAAFSKSWRAKFFAWAYAAFLCMPRLITGAHWLSDVVVGSGSITLFFWGWAFYSPLAKRCIDGIERVFKRPKVIHEKS